MKATRKMKKLKFFNDGIESIDLKLKGQFLKILVRIFTQKSILKTYFYQKKIFKIKISQRC